MKLLLPFFWPIPPRPLQSRGRALLAALVLTIAGLLPLGSRAQLVANYTFVPSAGTFTELTGATLVPTLRVDTGNTPAIPLGFTFQFEGVNYTSVRATSDGYLSFNPDLTSSTYNNAFNSITPTSDPLIAGLWDDLNGNVPTSQAGYAVTGAPGSRVFTFEWLRWGWNYTATAGSVSFQIKLREGSNQVELVYRPEAGTPTSPGASVGLRAAGGQGAGSFLSVTNLGTSATASSITATDNISAKPTASGLTFTFTPPPCNVPPTYASLPVNQSFEASWTDACATRNAAGASWRTTPLIGDQSWRRDDDGAAALWRSPTGYLPTPVASQGSRAAIFHSAYANAGSLGNLDLYVDLSPGGTKTLSFDYVNAASVGTNNPEKLEVLLSTDGGVTFGATPLLTLLVSPAYSAQSVNVPSSSATSVIRFRGTGEYGNSDIGIDNVRVTAATCAPPTAPVLSGITSTGATLSFTASASASSYTVTYQAAGGPTQTITPNPTASPVALTGLTPATIYTVSAVSNCGAGSTSPPTPTITFTTAPANDLCANAQALTPATPCAGTAGTVGGATGAGPAGSSGTADDDVWYSFVATSTQHRITVTENVYTNATDLSHEVFGGGSCPGASATPLFSSFQPTILATGLTVGQTYFVRVYSYYAVPLSPLEGAFTICVDQPSNVPTNDECAAAVSLTQATNTTCTATSGTVFGATQSTVSGGSTGTADDDVWYSFVATGAAASVALTNTGGLDLVVNLRTGPCGSSTSIRSGDQAGATAGGIDSVIVRNLTAGQTYYVRVYSYLNVPATATNGTFTLCVTTPPALPTTCASPTQVAAGSITATSATLGWVPGANGASYVVEYGPNNFVPGTGTVLNVAAPASAAPVSSLTPATTYQFYVTQTCASGQGSARVGPVSFTTLGAPPTCAPPTSLAARVITATSATLGWVPGTNGASYVVEYGLSGFTPGSGTAVNVAAPASDAAVSSLTPATTYQFYVTQTCASGQTSLRVGPASFTTGGAALNNLVVSTTQSVQGTYDNVTITPTGVATLGGALVVNQSLTVQDGGRLNSNCQLITGPGSFTLSAGGTLSICDPAGIAQTGATGTVQVAGQRNFSTDGLYVYEGPAPSARATGPGLPAAVRELTVNLPADLSLTNGGLDIGQVLRLSSANLSVPAGTRLRLLSGPGGTALVVNTGGGVTGPGAGTAQVQRYVNASLNAGRGYRHFSAPVGGAPLSQLGSGGSPVVTNVAFNAASATVRPTVVPFPTVFYYDQSQVPAAGALAAFDQGWTSPSAASSIMGTGQGFTMQASGAETITFQGPLTTGAVQLPGLGFGPNAAQAGWQLLGNPYPSPLDWSTLSVGTQATDNLQNLNGAVYVFQSSGPYAGTYRSYIGGIGNPLVASGQGFFVRTAGSGQSGTLRLGNANRVTTWSATNSTLYRSTADTRPQVHLRLSSPTAGLAPDGTVVYFEAGTTAGLDAAADAYKLRNPGAALNLFSLAGPEELSINGLPLPGGLPLTVPLGLSVPQAGSYTFETDQLLNFRAGDVQLRDALTGALVDLSQQPTYTFQVAAGSLSSSTRFALLFRPGTVTATAPALRAAQVGLFPNPARQEFTLTMPGLPTARTVVAELFNALGQRVLTQTLALPGSGLRAHFDVHALPTGVYSLRLTAGTEPPLIKRLTIE